jgi:hypothetical protein
MADIAAMKDIRGDDDAQLAAMGHKAELKRNFSLLYALETSTNHLLIETNYILLCLRSMLGLAFAILNVCDRTQLHVQDRYCIVMSID